MPSLLANNHRPRRSFGKVPPAIAIPNLIEIQQESYRDFLQADVEPKDRKNIGLQAVFKSVFPIRDFNKTASLEFISYTLEPPKWDVNECHQKTMTYAAPLKVTVQLMVWDINPETQESLIRDVKEEEVYFGEIPLMTDNGTFIINGTERVVVSQLHRSPGIFFDEVKGRGQYGGKMYTARIIPNRGSWIDFEFDSKDLLYVKIDRRRKLPATVLLRALKYSTEELLDYFYEREKIFLTEPLSKEFNPSLHQGQVVTVEVRSPDGKDVLARLGKKFTKAVVKKLAQAGITRIPILMEDLVGRVAAYDVVDMETGEVLVECNEELTEESIAKMREAGIEEIEVLFIDNVSHGPYLRDTLVHDKISSVEEALFEIYRRMRPGEPPTLETAQTYLDNLFFNRDRYDLSKVGRLKLNHKLGITNVSLEQTTLTRDDILRVVKYLIELKNGRGTPDDIDHLGNRRVRAVGELLENQYRIGLVRMERAVREKMGLQDTEAQMPRDLINAKPVSAAVKEFFGSSQLSQFMDQTNPLSEVTHKRRLSALGPGGLTRERAGYEVRDVHATHYGRICPIETPEGPNIGLISSLSTYGRVNEYGFIETPYRSVSEGRVSNDVDYYSALDEESHVIAPANVPLDESGRFVDEMVPARKGGDPALIPAEEVSLMDVAPNQLVSVAASLIPFLENDDANRALMGSNMQRQAVPLVKANSPFVGTGIERIVARDSGGTILARRSGIVEAVDATRIVVRATEVAEDADGEELGAEVDIYNLIKFRRSNQNTCLNQKPIVRKGDRVVKGDVLADGPSSSLGELALGQNVMVAFMPWGGYNFEDSILISERLVKDDVFTSVHIESYEISARDTKLGKEEITRDIPNVGEEALKDLDDSGIVRLGAEVKSGDILVGKITPKGETQLSPEEKLLRAIFGEKAGDVRDTSLRVPPGVQGTVINAQVLARDGEEKDERARQIQEHEIQRLRRDAEDERRTIEDSARRRLARILDGRIAAGDVEDPETGKPIVRQGDRLTPEVIGEIPFERWDYISVVDGEDAEEEIARLVHGVEARIKAIVDALDARIERLTRGDELPPGVIKSVRVFIAIKRKLSVGDKMAGRHGNKGVISKILPEEDMPYLPDGRPVDIVLNPLGVPSRMNVGQILETHLGWAALGLGEQLQAMLEEARSPARIREYIRRIYPEGSDVHTFLETASDDEVLQLAEKLKGGVNVATPVFDHAEESEIRSFLELADRDTSGQTILFDGRTGEAFDTPVTVGVMYMLKLHHLVDDKIHARSIGPYSLVTQQPLGGKAQFGGQRLGEMEVWALEAYGAAHALQEFLTVKSDDVTGRTRMYESIVKGENVLEAGLPESFNVLVKELQSLALDVDLIEESGSNS